uniref:Uncharacterized protein n=1 Tax=Anguilla anguilla TaxID=7936 RepID=A0A0E9U4R0_ANGAN
MNTCPVLRVCLCDVDAPSYTLEGQRTGTTRTKTTLSALILDTPTVSVHALMPRLTFR